MARPKKEEENKPGKISTEYLKEMINKKFGMNIAHNLSNEDISVKQWIPTGSTLLNAIICRGKMARAFLFLV